MTKTFYQRIMNAGVKIYEYKKGFTHAKCYLVDGETAMIGYAKLKVKMAIILYLLRQQNHNGEYNEPHNSKLKTVRLS